MNCSTQLMCVCVCVSCVAAGGAITITDGSTSERRETKNDIDIYTYI